MIYLFLCIAGILLVYLLLIFFVMKRVMAWEYKSLFYGLLTFIMLISIFLTFDWYEKNWKENNPLDKKTAVEGSSE